MSLPALEGSAATASTYPSNRHPCVSNSQRRAPGTSYALLLCPDAFLPFQFQHAEFFECLARHPLTIEPVLLRHLEIPVFIEELVQRPANNREQFGSISIRPSHSCEKIFFLRRGPHPGSRARVTQNHPTLPELFLRNE